VLGDVGEIVLIELAELASGLFAWGGTGGTSAVTDAKATVLSSDLVVVASPVYKASITGLLKAFFDHFGRDELVPEQWCR